MSAPNPQELRERADPVEGAEPVPVLVWVGIALLVAWGAIYFVLYAGNPGDVGDLRSPVAPPDPTAAVDGKAVYARACASCHQQDGTGVAGAFPPLAGSPWPVGDPSVPVRVVMDGLGGPIDVNGTTYDGQMPALGATLSDAEIAAVLTHVRSSWGNDAPPVTVDEVTKARGARTTPWTAAELGTP